MVEKIQSSVIGAAGEHLVLSELLKRNFVAGLAPFNTKDYDIVVLNKDGTNSFPIQVKTTSNNKRGWVMQEKHETPIKDLYYCFVYMTSALDNTEIYIVDSKTVANVIKTAHKIWLKVPGRNGQKHNPTKMRFFSRNVTANYFKNFDDYKDYLDEKEINFLNNYQEGWLEKFKDNWDSIKIK